LADVEVELLATLLPPATRQLLKGLENHVGRRSRPLTYPYRRA
jgi:hypothetical protein